MNFIKFRDAVKKKFEEMSKEQLYVVSVDKDTLWETYLNSFPEELNKIYRVRRKYDCSCCRHFIKNIGRVVSIKDGELVSVWDIDADDEFKIVADEMSKLVKHYPIENVYLSRFNTYGNEHTFGDIDGEAVRFEHLNAVVPKRFIYSGRDTIDTERGIKRSTKEVFKRSLDEIGIDSIDTVLELISQNSLYRGEEWKSALTEFRKIKKEYEKVDIEKRDTFVWDKSISAGPVVGRIRNHSIGTLLVDISEGVELDEAVRKYERIVAPTNYKRPKAIFTQKMLDDAKKTVIELGYEKSLGRRFATLDDITVNNILFSNKDSAKRIEGTGDLFDELSKDTKKSPKKFSKVETIGIDKFISDILPTASEVELYLENKHMSNMVSLIAPKDDTSPSMFKWENSCSWAYKGNITDSMKERVKNAGGKVDGDLRFSIQWNDLDTWDRDDLDAHCIEPSGEEIMYSHKHSRTYGELDVDITRPLEGVPAVENITWESRRTMKPGVYKFFVHQFAERGGRSGFRAEIEFDGKIYSFDYNRPLRQDEKVMVAYVTLDGSGNFSIESKLPSSESSKEIWGLSTNTFVPVSVICYSPNYWNEQDSIGHKHYFFMLKGCINDENPNGFYNEFLKKELETHKRVFEALGSKARVEDCDDQLSGVGFSSTKRADVVVKVIGATERIIKIEF